MVWAEAIVGALLSPSFQVLLDILLYLFATRRSGDTSPRRLEIALSTISAVLGAAEEKQITNPLVKRWVDELKDAAYDADDLLDDINTHGQINAGVLERLQKMIERLEDIAKWKDLLGLKESLDGKPSPRLPTTSLLGESEVYGREEDVREIKKLLVSDDTNANRNHIPIIVIHGIGGVGKTTLAQLLYNDGDVRNRFPSRAWAYVSEQFDVLEVTKTILDTFDFWSFRVPDLDKVQVRLKWKLAGKRFLLVLDDVWKVNFLHWEDFLKSLVDVDRGSRIIVTTRNQSVASIMHADHTYQLQLSEKACTEVFKKYAFSGKSADAHANLMGFGEKIVKKCKGLPLAAKTLGSLLYSNVEAREWEKILNSKIWDLPSEKNGILPSLRLSYQYLPSHLKQCFAYCSIFPKGYVFEKQNLVLLWMAEGLLPQPRGDEKTMEEVGNDYFEELLARSFFQKSSGENSSFSMHDLFNELAQFVSGEFCLKFENDHQRNGITKRTRHFAFLRQTRRTIDDIFVDLIEAKDSLRTFLPTSLSPSSGCPVADIGWTGDMPKLRCLRVFSLHGYAINKLPDAFGESKHLRYLDFSNTLIKLLPKSVCSLHHLQTLKLSKCSKLKKLPDSVDLKNLHHLDLSETRIRSLPESICSSTKLQTLKLSSCSRLTKLPPKFKNLNKLVHLHLDGTDLLEEMPPAFGNLRSLQTLTTFVVSKTTSASRITHLEDLVHLRGELSILGLQNVENVADAKTAKLEDKGNVKELTFFWKNDQGQEKQTDVLQNLRPHENLEKLTIKTFGGTKFPVWLGASSFFKLVSLTLIDCKSCSTLPPLSRLPSLEEIILKKMILTSFGQGGSSSNPYKSLRILHFEGMREWFKWLSFPGEFPLLEELHIEKCPQLSDDLPCVPSLKSLHIEETKLKKLHISNELQDLQIRNCNDLESVEVSEDPEQQPKSLRTVDVADCKNLKVFGRKELRIPELKLEKFPFPNCDNLRLFPEQFNDFISETSSLSSRPNH